MWSYEQSEEWWSKFKSSDLIITVCNHTQSAALTLCSPTLSLSPRDRQERNNHLTRCFGGEVKLTCRCYRLNTRSITKWNNLVLFPAELNFRTAALSEWSETQRRFTVELESLNLNDCRGSYTYVQRQFVTINWDSPQLNTASASTAFFSSKTLWTLSAVWRSPKRIL